MNIPIREIEYNPKLNSYLNTINGSFVLNSQKASINLSAELFDFMRNDNGYITIHSEEITSEKIHARSILYHELIHYYQTSMTPIAPTVMVTTV